jgi:hypothetical protein
LLEHRTLARWVREVKESGESWRENAHPVSIPMSRAVLPCRQDDEMVPTADTYTILASVDWGEVTAASTASLALLTLLLVVYARHAANQAKRSIDVQLQAIRESTRAAQTATQRQIEASYRPLLIGVTAHGPVYDDMGAQQLKTHMGRDQIVASGPQLVTLKFAGGQFRADPRKVYAHFSPGRIEIMVPLRNVGWGLAVIDTLGIEFRGQGLRKKLRCEAQIDCVPPGETTRLLCEYELTPREQPIDHCTYDLLVPYRDLAGGQLAVAVARLDAQPEGTESWTIWELRSVKQVQLGDLAPPLELVPAAK